MGKKQVEKQAKGRLKKGLRILSIFALGFLLFLAFTLLGIYYTPWFGHFDREKLENVPQSTLFYTAQNEVYDRIYAQNRVYTPLNEIPEKLQAIFLTSEDHRFYSHPGIDFIRIGGALLKDLQTFSLKEGASTITQQLVKNTHLTNEKTLKRKLREAVLALQLEKAYSKEEILEMYLNQIYFGHGAYGIASAAEVYFQTSVRNLSYAQTASLAAIIKSPTRYAPHLEKENNLVRRNHILKACRENGTLTQEEYEQAIKEELIIKENGKKEQHAAFTDAVILKAQQLLSLASDQLATGGYHIYTTMDMPRQSLLETLAQDDGLFPASAQDGTLCQCAVVWMNPQNGEVLALLGGRQQAGRRNFHRALQMKRSPGSALKPFCVYVPALESGLSPASPLLDEAQSFGSYTPNNASGKFHGWVSMREALAHSYNVPAVSLLNQLGIDKGIESLTRFHLPVHKQDAYLPLALGSMTQGVTPLALCSAYAALGNGGVYQQASLIRKITDSHGHVLYEREEEGENTISQENAFLLSSMLQSVVRDGTAGQLADLQLPLAAKTGTVSFGAQGNRDIWACAYTSKEALTVWMGFDTTDDAHCIPSGNTGSTYPCLFIKRALQSMENRAEPFPVPKGIYELAMDKISYEQDHSLCLATPYTPESHRFYECFAQDESHFAPSPYWQLPEAPPAFSVTEGYLSYPAIHFLIPNDHTRVRIFRREGAKTEEIAVYQGKQYVVHTDMKAARMHTYLYYAVPEIALSVDAGIEAAGKSTDAQSYYVPFSFPFPKGSDGS